MKAKLRSLGGSALLGRRGPGEGGIEGLAEPLSLLPGVRLDVALGDVDPHRDLPPPLRGFHLVQDGDGGQAGGALNAFHNFLKANGLPLIRFHDLRHSCATLLREEGVPMEDIQKWLGHSTITTTEGIYAHFDENGHIGTANKVADAFGEDDIAKDPKEEAVAK